MEKIVPRLSKLLMLWQIHMKLNSWRSANKLSMDMKMGIP
jgi:hypothetical protein